MVQDTTTVIAVLVLDGSKSFKGVRCKNPDGSVFDIAMEDLESAGVQEDALQSFSFDTLFKYGGKYITEEELRTNMIIEQHEPTFEELKQLRSIISTAKPQG